MEMLVVLILKVKFYIKKYIFEEVLKVLVEYFNGDDFVVNVWVNKYVLKDFYGNIYECILDDMYCCIVVEIVCVEICYFEFFSEEEVYVVLKDFKYIVLQGSLMVGIGNLFQIFFLFNCFVIGSGVDFYGGIVKVDEEQVQLMKCWGGVGQDFFYLCFKGLLVMNSVFFFIGIVLFMECYFNFICEVVQDGCRGVLMLIVFSCYLDVEGFIDVKLEQGKVIGVNVLVWIDDVFMKVVIEGKFY